MSLRWQRSDHVILLIVAKIAYHLMGQQQAGSLAGAAPCRKDIDRTQRRAHPAWKPGAECEGKSSSECILKSKKCMIERLA